MCCITVTLTSQAWLLCLIIVLGKNNSESCFISICFRLELVKHVTPLHSSQSLATPLSAVVSVAAFVLLTVSLPTSIFKCNCVLMWVWCRERPMVLSASFPSFCQTPQSQPPDYMFTYCHVGTAQKHGCSIILTEEHINTQVTYSVPIHRIWGVNSSYCFLFHYLASDLLRSLCIMLPSQPHRQQHECKLFGDI